MKKIVRILAWGILLGLIACRPAPDTAGTVPDAPLPDTVTFSADIAPVVYANCTPCHRPGSAGPFSLITYEDLARRARTIARVTRDRYMPPWPADPGYRHFVGERILTEREIALFQAWAAQGALPGDLAHAPPPPVYPEGSQLGKPDLVLRMPGQFPLPGDNRDRFFFMKIPYEIAQDTFIRAIEFVPGNTKAVHHMNANLIGYEPGAKQDVFAGDWYVNRDQVLPQVAYPRMGLPNDDGSYPELTPMVCNYLPGVTPALYPEGIGGFRMKRKGAFLLNDIHYGPLPQDTFDQSYLNIFFAPAPPVRPTRDRMLGTIGISPVSPPLVIPPDTVMTCRTRWTVDEDISVLTLNPHMHLLGKSFKAWALPPGGDTIPLIRIPEWDFRWQYFYTLEYMLPLRKGTVIEVEGVFDNTADNPHNPNDPPRLVSDKSGSMRTTDEMLQFILTCVPYRPGDESIRLGPASGSE
ncbi:MAG: cytochrome c [Bacteroidia bacterium]|nr:cytochrome c [Bacteroidia bacterium]